ncbi:hypothetical protein XENTR_v10000447 [Xenopus tropicalis]|nr:hypothetical protein XENTR_v10000447 [Xenopus tropicalis]KAE8629344.1 hypothetical protein XENTR_v10000447 [Xenopus tropicalis]
MASFEMLYAILDDFRADSDDFEALASYYEHHYRRRYGKIVDLEHFLIMYMVDPRVTDKRNIPDYLAMIHFMEQLEELEREYRVLCTERLLTPYTPEERLLRWEYLEILRLQNVSSLITSPDAFLGIYCHFCRIHAILLGNINLGLCQYSQKKKY